MSIFVESIYVCGVNVMSIEIINVCGGYVYGVYACGVYEYGVYACGVYEYGIYFCSVKNWDHISLDIAEICFSVYRYIIVFSDLFI